MQQVKSLAVLIPRITAFISSACIMIIEIVAGRMIAKYLGSTLYVWTSVIGVVLGGIAIGNYIGGKIADRYHPRKSLAVLFGISSVACVLTVFSNTLTGGFEALWLLPLPIRSLAHVTLVFLLPSALLGTISPVIAKMALDLGLPQGNTIGSIYAWGAAGSIAGTFLAGFVLIALIGTSAIVWSVGAVLLLLGILYWFKFIPFYPWAVFFFLLAFIGVAPVQWASDLGSDIGLKPARNPSIVYEKESEYCYIAVEQTKKNPDTRQFIQDDLKSHSRIIMNDIMNLQYTYTKLFAGLTNLVVPGTEKRTFLSIGGGGFVFPRYLEAKFPGSMIDAVEIDPAVTEAAYAAFGLTKSSGIRIHNIDARIYMNALFEGKRMGKPLPTYDIVFGDAYGGSYVPYQIVTREYNDMIFSILSERGAYVTNMVDLYTDGRFLGTFINTLKKTFPNVYVISEHVNFYLGNNFVVVGSKLPIDVEKLRGEKAIGETDLWFLDIYETNSLVKKAGGRIFTDDFAPVEQALSNFAGAHAKYLLAQKYIAKGNRLLEEGKKPESIREYEDTAAIVPEMSIPIYSKIGEIYADLESWDNVIRAGEKAIEYNDRSSERVPVGEIHYMIGITLLNLKRPSEGMPHVRKAIEQFTEDLKKNPLSPETLFKCGNAYMYAGDRETAIVCFDRSLSLDRFNVETRLTYATALILLKQYDKSRDIISEGIRLTEQKGDVRGSSTMKDFLDHFEEKKKEYSDFVAAEKTGSQSGN
jgi:tetratricopeptide (TPR) repeat protein/MFS family permease